VPALAYALYSVILRLSVFVQCQLVTDRGTDGRTTTAYTVLA